MKHRDDKGHYEWQKITDCVPLLGPSQGWHHHLSTTTHQGHESFYAAHTTSSSRLELCILRASFIKAKTNLPWCVPSGVIDVTPQAQGQAEMKTEKELGQMMRTRMNWTQTQRWWPSSCLLREKIVLALLNDFFQLNSSPNISQKEITQRKRRLHVYPEFPRSPWHTAHAVNQSIYCHFNNHSGYFCH